MQKRLIILLLACLAVGLVLAARSCNRTENSVTAADASYPLRCIECSELCRMTGRELEREVRAGRVESPPEQMRRFTCPACGKVALVLHRDEGRN